MEASKFNSNSASQWVPLGTPKDRSKASPFAIAFVQPTRPDSILWTGFLL